MCTWFAAAAASTLLLVGSACAQQFVAEPADDWTAVFNRRQGWTGGDGTLSFPLGGVEAPGREHGGLTMFLFGDSIIGRVDQNGRRRPGAQIINNAVMFYQGDQPAGPEPRFWFRRDDQGNPLAAIVPSTPDALPGDYYWLTDGISIEGKVFIFATHLRPSGGTWPSNQGVAMITLPPGSRPPFEHQEQSKPPLFVPSPGGDTGPMQFPAGFMSNTRDAGAPFPDGYLYVYGVREDPFIKKAVVGRVLPASFEDFSSWRFWNGSDWVIDAANSEPITSRVSGLYSVTPLRDGRYLMVFQLDAIGADVAVRIGDSPAGPWGPPINVYTCPEIAENPNAVVYNTVAHPEISAVPDELIISYNVNSWDFGEAIGETKWSTPRFIRLRLVR